MKNPSSFVAFGLTILLALGMAGTTLTPGAQANGFPDFLGGSWLFSITPPPQGPPPYTVLTSLSDSGVLTAATQNDHFAPYKSEQHGTWISLGRGRYASTQYYFGYDGTGAAVGLFKLIAEFHLTGRDTLSGSGALELCDLHGQNCNLLGGGAQVAGTRIKVEKLP